MSQSFEALFKGNLQVASTELIKTDQGNVIGLRPTVNMRSLPWN